MTFLNIAKTTFFACGLALATTSADASTIASINIENGDFNVGAGSIVGGGVFDSTPAFQFTGDFDAFVDLTFDPDTLAEYTLAADLTVDGSVVFDESISVVTTATDLVLDAIDIVTLIDGLLPGVIGNLLNETLDGDLAQTEIFPDVWFGLDFALADNDISDGTIDGSFTAVLSGLELADPSSLFFLTTPGTAFSGSASVSVDMSAVPLPASAPLLGFAVFGLIALRRRARG